MGPPPHDHSKSTSRYVRIVAFRSDGRAAVGVGKARAALNLTRCPLPLDPPSQARPLRWHLRRSPPAASAGPGYATPG
eukprot:1095929-Prorocentrum_minimum.AAC.2